MDNEDKELAEALAQKVEDLLIRYNSFLLPYDVRSCLWQQMDPLFDAWLAYRRLPEDDTIAEGD